MAKSGLHLGSFSPFIAGNTPLSAAAAFDYILFDDTSRLSRDLSDVLDFEKLMRHYGVKVCFVSQKLDSNDPNFMMLLSMYGIVDSQFIARLRAKVQAGQMGRVLAGFHVGSIPYGYRGVTVENLDSGPAIGRAATKGTILEVIENEAEVIRRIFQLYADGHSMWAICVELNLEKVPSPRNVHSGKQTSEWSRDAIKRILHNEKYRGVNVWNISHQKKHPKTGAITKEYKPAHEHKRSPDFSQTEPEGGKEEKKRGKKRCCEDYYIGNEL
jgi:site-specific DNA recombinase